jgi:peroxiredoxin
MKIEVGMQFPEFVVNTHLRDNASLSEEFKKTSKTVLWVLRYVGCTVCRYDCHLINQNYSKFRDKDSQVLVVMQSDRQHVVNDLKTTDEKLAFEIICDPDQTVYSKLEIKPADTMEQLAGGRIDDLKVKGAAAKEAGFVHGDYEGNEQQLPAMFIVDTNGTVVYAHYAANIMDMPKVEEILELL